MMNKLKEKFAAFLFSCRIANRSKLLGREFYTEITKLYKICENLTLNSQKILQNANKFKKKSIVIYGNYHYFIFILLLWIVTGYVITFVISFFFKTDSLTYLTLSTLSHFFPNINNYSSKIDGNLFDKNKFGDVLSLIVSALSSILAIVFSLTFISIERISEKYSPFIIEIYKNDRRTKNTLYVFVFVIVASILLILVKDLISNFALLVYSIGLTISCILCFSLLIVYYYFVIDIINPRTFASILEKKVLNYAKDGKKEKAEELITRLGDITINSLKRDEQDISAMYLESIYGIFLQSCEKFKNFTYLDTMLNSYRRIINYCIRADNELRYSIIDIYAEIPGIFSSISGNNGKEISKFSEEITSQYLEYLDNLFYINQSIIDENDFRLFKEEIDSISLRFVDDPKELKEDIKSELILVDINIPEVYLNNEIIMKIKQIKILLDNLQRNFSDFSHYISLSNEFDNLLLIISKFMKTEEEKDKTFQKFESFKKSLFKFFLDSNFHKIFFIIGAYCLFNRRERDIESDKYLRELWLHTESKNPYHINLNQVPVTSDIEFLFNMLFWGGQNKSSWYDKYSFEAFHDSRIFLYRYSILLLTHLRERKNEELTIQISKNMEKDELVTKYEFLQRFIKEADELIEFCDEFVNEAEKWSFLFPPKKQKIKTDSEEFEESIVEETSTKDQFENSKMWLFTKKEEFEKIVKEIDADLPIDPEKEEICRKEITVSYESHSEIHKVVTFSQLDIDIDKDLELIKIGLMVPKDCFLRTSYVDCSSIWFESGRFIAFKEINYFIKHIIETTKNVERIPLHSKNIMEIYSQIESLITLLKNNGYNPSTIFIPLDILYDFRKESLNKESKLYNKFLYSEEIFRYDSSTTMEIVHSSKFVTFQDIIILDKKYAIWKFKPVDENKQIFIKIEKYKENPSNVHITVETAVNLRIDDFDSLKIIKTSRD